METSNKKPNCELIEDSNLKYKIGACENDITELYNRIQTLINDFFNFGQNILCNQNEIIDNVQ